MHADLPFADQHRGNPQSWNLYFYARNNPLRYLDNNGEEVKEAIKIATYAVHGATAREARNNAKQTSGFKSETGEPMSGETKATMTVTNEKWQISSNPTNNLVDSYATAEVTSADVKLDQTITLPEWKERDSADPAEQKNWDTSQ